MNRRLFISSVLALLLIPLQKAKAQVSKRTVVHFMLIDHVALGLTDSTCSDWVLAKLGHSPTFKLKADNENDTVHGAVMIRHSVPPEQHLIRIEIYESDDSPKQGRKSFLKKHVNPPTDDEIRDKLNR